jgi:hypothetical protein
MNYEDADYDWSQPSDKINSSILDLLDEGWRTTHIKEELERLNISSHKNSRQGLITDLITEFANPQRIKAGLNELPEEIQKYYIYLNLWKSLYSRFTTPVSFHAVFPTTLSESFAQKKILDVGLAIAAESGELYIPSAVLSALPPSSINFPVDEEPDAYIPAKSPSDVLLRIQKIMCLFYEREFVLRKQLRWKPSDHGTYNQMYCWPPHPEDAKKIMSNFRMNKKIALLPPAPQLDEESLEFWSESMHITPELSEFYYHLLIQGGILHAGSPVRINQLKFQQWLELPAGRQVIVLYELYRSLSTWAVWWPRWRSGQIDIQWAYDGYYGLSHVDSALLSTNLCLQGVFLDILSFLPQGVWLNLDKVIDWMMVVFPEVGTHRYFRGLSIESVQKGWKGWLRLVLHLMLTGPLHTLGIADITPNINHIAGFRLNQLQDMHWRRENNYKMEILDSVVRRHIEVDSESEIMYITIPINPDYLSMLQLWSKFERVEGDRLLFRLDLEKLHKAYEQGYTPSRLYDAWQNTTGYPPIESLQVWWDYWWQKYGQIRIYPPRAILVTRDQLTMKEVQLTLSSLEESNFSIITPTTAMLNSKDADQAIGILERQGYMPKKVG